LKSSVSWLKGKRRQAAWIAEIACEIKSTISETERFESETALLISGSTFSLVQKNF
jgi:hypothetical protein